VNNKPTIDDFVNATIAAWKKEHILVDDHEYAGLRGKTDLIVTRLQRSEEAMMLACGAFLMDCRTPTTKLNYLTEMHSALHRELSHMDEADAPSIITCIRDIDIAYAARRFEETGGQQSWH